RSGAHHGGRENPFAGSPPNSPPHFHTATRTCWPSRSESLRGRMPSAAPRGTSRRRSPRRSSAMCRGKWVAARVRCVHNGERPDSGSASHPVRTSSERLLERFSLLRRELGGQRLQTVLENSLEQLRSLLGANPLWRKLTRPLYF